MTDPDLLPTAALLALNNLLCVALGAVLARFLL